MARQVYAIQIADIAVKKNCRAVVCLEREPTAFVSIVSSDYMNAGGQQAMRKAACAAEKVDGDGGVGSSIRTNGVVHRWRARHPDSN
jgi:hypothetical protein